jgi:predicted GTPase
MGARVMTTDIAKTMADKAANIDAAIGISNAKLRRFVTSHNLSEHPLAVSPIPAREAAMYYAVLKHFLEKCTSDADYANARLAQYKRELLGDAGVPVLTEDNAEKVIRSAVNSALSIIQPRKKKYRHWLLCDLAFLLIEKNEIKKAYNLISEYLGQRQRALYNELIKLLFNDYSVPKPLMFAENSIEHFRTTRRFSTLPKLRILVTANVSAGKSTFINAIVGKRVAKVSQKICTAELRYFHNKPYEDGAVHLFSSRIDLDAKMAENGIVAPEEAAGAEVCHVAAHFKLHTRPQANICLIDSPGVDAVRFPEHRQTTYEALRGEDYDKLIYLFDATSSGSDKENKHLTHVLNTVREDKIIFVINKMDVSCDSKKTIPQWIDDVEEDIQKVRAALKLEDRKPAIYPVSSQLALYAKLGRQLTECETHDYETWKENFSKPELDLSRYYRNCAVGKTEKDGFMAMYLKSGFYNLENILFN